MPEARHERVESVDATDWRDEFGSEPEHSPPDRMRSGDSTDELDAFAAAPAVDAEWTGADVKESHPSRFDWMRPARRAALVCSVLAAAAGGVLVLRTPAEPLWNIEPPEPAIVTPAIDAPANGDVERAGGTPLVLVDSTLSPAVDDPPAVPPGERRSAPVGAPRVEATTQNSYVRTVPSATAPWASRADGETGPPTALAAAIQLAPDVEMSASIPPPAAGVSPVVAGASATASSPAEPSRSTSTNVSVQAAAEPSGRELETRAIEDVLERYRNAFNRLDAGAASMVWPTVDEKTLARAFERLRYQNVFFSSCQIVLGAMFAEATCIGSARYEPKVGSRATRPEARRWRFGLRKSGGAWLIDRVDMR